MLKKNLPVFTDLTFYPASYVDGSKLLILFNQHCWHFNHRTHNTVPCM